MREDGERLIFKISSCGFFGGNMWDKPRESLQCSCHLRVLGQHLGFWVGEGEGLGPSPEVFFGGGVGI